MKKKVMLVFGTRPECPRLRLVAEVSSRSRGGKPARYGILPVPAGCRHRMTARPIRRNAQTPDRNGKIFYTSFTSLSHINKVTGNQAAYGRWRCRSDRYTACTITGEFVLAGAVGKENTHG